MATPEKVTPATVIEVDNEVATTAKDTIATSYYNTTPSNATIARLPAPLMVVRLVLYGAALLFALAVLVAQSVLMNKKYRGTYFSTYYYYSYYAYTSGYSYTTYTVSGKEYAKAPSLVIVVAVFALVLAVALAVFVLVPAIRLSLWAAVLEVVLVSLLLMLWVSALGVSAKTADVMKESWWPKPWKGSNIAALVFETLSLFVWGAVLALGVISLIRIFKARKAAQEAPAACPEP